MRKLLVCLALSLVASPANASVMLALDLAELAAGSDSIVVGDAVSSHAEARAGRIVTIFDIDVVEPVAGTVSEGERITILVPGGELDGLGLLVHGAPEVSLGQRYLLFLRRHENTHTVVGMVQGALPVWNDSSGEQMVDCPADMPELMRLQSGQLVPAVPARISPALLPDVIVEIQEARRAR